MEISVIASGSNGNCLLVEEKGISILVDAGKSCRETEKRLNKLGKSPDNIKAIVISHSHTDHVRGAAVISRKYDIPVYMMQETYQELGYYGMFETKYFSPDKSFRIASFQIRPIPTSHDVNSCGFVINNFGIFTDTGFVTKLIRDAMPKLRGVLIESNHDIDMLIKGPYPTYLKYRILGNHGHLSNIHASELVRDRGKNLSFCLLGHLSEVNNTPEIAKTTFETIVKRRLDYSICSRDRETGSFIL